MKPLKTKSDIKQLVDSFYEKVNENELLSKVFNDHAQIDWETHLPRMYNFWNTVLLYQGDYKGSPFEKHVRLPIQKEHFSEWLRLFNQNIDEQFEGPIAEDAKKVAASIGLTFQSKMGLL